MPISLGTTTITALYLGTTSITSAYLGNTQVFGGSFTPLDLFSGGAQGIWLDPSDLSTMFSDRAGTTPVTTPGTVVGVRLDKSKGLALGADVVVNGSFGTGTTSSWVEGINGGTITVASGVVTIDNVAGNGNTGIHQDVTVPANSYVQVTYNVGGTQPIAIFSNGATFGSSMASTETAGLKSLIVGPVTSGIIRMRFLCNPSKTATATAITCKVLAGNHAVAPTDAARPTYGVEPKGGRRNLLLATDTLATQSLTVTAVAHTLAFTGTGTVTLSGASIAGPLIGTGASDRVSLTFTPTAASLTLTVVGSVTLGQLELGSSATAYQKVVTAYNVTESGVATTHYVQYDGSDDSMSTAAIDFTGTDKMSVFAGVRKLSDAAQGVVVELSATIASNNRSFLLAAPDGATATFGFDSKGTAQVDAIASSLTAPISRIVTGLADIAGDTATIRIDGVQADQDTGDQGTGNFGNYAMFIGRRNNASLPFNGRDYGLIVVGKAASAGEITDTETWLAAKTAQVTL